MEMRERAGTDPSPGGAVRIGNIMETARFETRMELCKGEAPGFRVNGNPPDAVDVPALQPELFFDLFLEPGLRSGMESRENPEEEDGNDCFQITAHQDKDNCFFGDSVDEERRKGPAMTAGPFHGNL